MFLLMRTTITIENDLMAAIKLRAIHHKISVIEVLNRVLRRGLAEESNRKNSAPTVVFGNADEKLDHHALQDRIRMADAADDLRMADL